MKSYHPSLYISIVVFAIINFCLSYTLEYSFEQRGVFNEFNILFDSDPNLRIQNFAEGTGAGGRNLIHPNLSNFIHPPIFLLARLFSSFFFEDEAGIRRHLALYIVPLSNAIKASLAILIFDAIGLNLPALILLSILNITSFSQLIFGSIPDHFALSGCLLTGVYYLLLKRRLDSGYRFCWILCGVLMFGITITNLIPYTIMLLWGYYGQHRNLRKTLLFVVQQICLIILINFAIFAIFAPFHSWKQYFLPHHKPFLQKTVPGIWENKYLSHAIQFPQTLKDTLYAPRVTIIENTFGIRMNPDAKYDFAFTCENPTRSWWLAIPILLVLIFCCYRLYSHTPEARLLLLPTLSIILYNWGLHSLYGYELFLYSQHWQFALLFIVSGILCGDRKSGFINRSIAVVFVITMIWNNGSTLHFIFETLLK